MLSLFAGWGFNVRAASGARFYSDQLGVLNFIWSAFHAADQDSTQSVLTASLHC